MHGILYKSLKDFVIENRGKEVWVDVCEDAGVDERIFLTIDTYDDGKLFDIVEAAASRFNVRRSELLESYGRFAAGQLLKTHYNVVRDEWGPLDLIANAAEIHGALRARNPNVNPPELVCQRNGDAEVTVVYRSQRKLCSFGQGVLLGIGEHYDVELIIREVSCMHDGDEYCMIVVQR